jgi:hypothetical protein
MGLVLHTSSTRVQVRKRLRYPISVEARSNVQQYCLQFGRSPRDSTISCFNVKGVDFLLTNLRKNGSV